MFLVHGDWATWGVWTECTSTCGPNGTRTRDRTCTDPTPLYGGDDCNSTISGNLETETCNTEINCPGKPTLFTFWRLMNVRNTELRYCP